MLNFFKKFLIFLGGALIGFGIGITSLNFLILDDINYWLLFMATLVLGGFLLALGIIIGKNSSKDKGKETKENLITEQKTNKEKNIDSSQGINSF